MIFMFKFVFCLLIVCLHCTLESSRQRKNGWLENPHWAETWKEVSICMENVHIVDAWKICHLVFLIDAYTLLFYSELLNWLEMWLLTWRPLQMRILSWQLQRNGMASVEAGKQGVTSKLSLCSSLMRFTYWVSW